VAEGIRAWEEWGGYRDRMSRRRTGTGCPSHGLERLSQPLWGVRDWKIGVGQIARIVRVNTFDLTACLLIRILPP
jgi:hypothetical protein